ncbi:MAG: helix-turn-helix domain-containing protein [Candidatus Methanoperedenaceae archaeon]|nr:helix-turn-helix domain-containing protein [Candidatus Methanoperedenaceae archaeon]
MTEDDRINDILKTIKKIQESKQPIKKYFENNFVSFSQSQYYKYCKILQKYGEEGLHDHREDGNYTKLTPIIKGYIRATVKENRSIASSELKIKILDAFGVSLSEDTIHIFRVSESLTRIPINKPEYHYHKSGGGEILTFLAFYTGIIEIITKTIIHRVDEIRQKESIDKSKTFKPDHPEVRNHGKFTLEYNQQEDVRNNRFKSIDEKIPQKNLLSMNIFLKSDKIISRYNLALLCLPLVTSNGKSSRINRPKGNDIEFLSGYNYKDVALDRYLRELKYLKISDQLLIETAKFWMDFWKEEENEETCFVCYYIDGNTKALWSSNSCYKGKATMLGRVMNCLENVFIHDGKGHPLYFQTFQGHADIGKHALNMVHKLTTMLDDPSAHIQVNRIIVFDAGGNGVKTLRGFNDSDEYYITILDENQTKDRKFKHKQLETQYKYGNARLIDCQIELKDSDEKDYIYESRAVIVNWDNGRKAVIITDIPRELLDESEVVKKYFDRWPFQEKVFREEKSGVHIQYVSGHGTKIDSYDKMVGRHKKICETISHLKLKLGDPLVEINVIDAELTDLYQQEKVLREKSNIVDGKRILDDADAICLKECESNINRCIRQKAKIEKEHEEDFDKLRRNVEEEKRVRGKDKVYRVDVELDQIMTCFKMSFVNLCSFFLIKCLEGQKFELLTLMESIFQLDGVASVSGDRKVIDIEMNPKEPDLMDKLYKGLQILNTMQVHDLEGREIGFKV